MKKNLPKISIITPSYNQGPYIERTIQSVLNQNYPNLEFIIMDGGSTDQTISILKKYGKKIIWKSENDKGQADAINKGLQLATGDILAYLNSDDTYEPSTLNLIATFFLEHPDAKFVYGEGGLIDPADRHIGLYNTLPEDFEKLFVSCGISQPTCFWKREVLEKVGLFDPSYNYTMDYEYWVRVSQHFKLHFIPKVLANTRIHHEAKTSKFTHALHEEALQLCLHYYGKVGHDWIFTYTDSAYTEKKETPQYFRYMIVQSIKHFWYFNHALPPRSSWRILVSWLKNSL